MKMETCSIKISSTIMHYVGREKNFFYQNTENENVRFFSLLSTCCLPDKHNRKKYFLCLPRILPWTHWLHEMLAQSINKRAKTVNFAELFFPDIKSLVFIPRAVFTAIMMIQIL